MTIGLAIVGCGTIGRVRAVLAREHPGIGWLGLCDVDKETAIRLGDDTAADLVTTDLEELLSHPEVTAVIVATAENEHVEPIMQSVARRFPLFIEKPLATDPSDSAAVLAAIEAAEIEAVMGYTPEVQAAVPDHQAAVVDGEIGTVTSVVTRALMNRMVPIATLLTTEQRTALTPMVVSGTHSLDLCLWLMEGKEPVEVYARSIDPVLAEWGTKDATFGTVHHGRRDALEHEHQLGTPRGVARGGVRARDRDHRDRGRDRYRGHPPRCHPRLVRAPGRRVHHQGVRLGDPPRRLHRQLPTRRRRRRDAVGADARGDDDMVQPVAHGHPTPHATAFDGHRNLMLTMAMDLSARRAEPVKLPVGPDELTDS